MLSQWNRKDHDGISTRAPIGRLIETLEPRTLLSGGTLDPGFGQGGYVKGYAGMAVQSDGSIIAQQVTPAGAIGSPGALVLMHPDGSIAGPYSGPVPQPPPTNGQADGKYLVINGNSAVSGNTVTRHNRDGSVDTTFGNNGTVSDFTSGTPYVSFNPETITVQGNQILVGGRLVGAENTDYLAIVRLNSDGSIDRAFGVNGVAHGDADDLADSTAYQIQIGPNTNLYEAGQQSDDPTLQAFTPNGSFVAAQNILAPYDDHVYGLGFSFGKVYFLAGYESGYDVLAAYDLNLNPDTGFGDFGQVSVLPPDGDPNSPPPGFQPGRLLLGPDGRIFVSNYYDFEGTGTNSEYLIAYTPDWPASSGAISGFIYNDANANGTKDAGDTALRYWQAFADTNGNGIFDAGEPTAYSDYNGYYKIYGLTPGTYKVYEVVQDGWTRTEPAAAWPNSDHVVTVTAGVTSGNNNFGNTQPGSQPGSVSGTFFYDSNANGTWDSGESPSASWLVYLDSNNNGMHDSGETEIRADSAGRYTFSNLAPGTYHIRPETASGWTETYPTGGTQTVTVASGQNVTGINFGEVRGTPTVNGSISGTVFYDKNGNGTWDSGEGISPYWLIYLDSNNNGVYDSNETQVRGDANGHYTFPNLAPGSYSVRIRSASGWTQTYPASGGANLVTLGSGQNVSNANFGEVQGTPAVKGSISGTVFYDTNGNGVWDSGESPSPSWLLYIDANNNGVYDSNETQVRGDANGRYTFPNLAPGTYTLRIFKASGWTQTYPANFGAQVVMVGSGQNVGNVNFGEVRGTPAASTGSISGTFFYDSNGNGAWDSSETTSPYWLVYLDSNNNHVHDAGETEIRADGNGNYRFSALPAGTYYVRPESASGWSETYPAGGTQVISLASGQNVSSANFGELRGTPTVVMLSQTRYVVAPFKVDYYTGTVPPPMPPVSAPDFGSFDGSTNDGFTTPVFPYDDASTDQIQVSGSATQNSTVSPTEIVESGALSASESDTRGGGQSFGEGRSFLSITFQVNQARQYHLLASLTPTRPQVVDSATISLTRAGGPDPLPQLQDLNVFDPLKVDQQGILAPGTYTLTYDVSSMDNNHNLPSATYSLDLSLGDVPSP